MIEGQVGDKEREVDAEHGRKGRNGNYPGCTAEFVKRTKKRRKKNELAKASRRKNRK